MPIHTTEVGPIATARGAGVPIAMASGAGTPSAKGRTARFGAR
jgi:hypothetical protein